MAKGIRMIFCINEYCVDATNINKCDDLNMHMGITTQPDPSSYNATGGVQLQANQARGPEK